MNRGARQDVETPKRTLRRWITLGIAAALAGALVLPVYAAELNVEALAELTRNGRGPEALEAVAAAALELGPFTPAPGDVAVFCPWLPANTLGLVNVVDRPSSDCTAVPRHTDGCDKDYAVNQNYVCYGPSMFLLPQGNGDRVPRAAPDDLLSTYIEEVGHSWQEYFFETNGAGETTYDDSLVLIPGWEFQIKAYILSLDGVLLALSAEEHARLVKAMCSENGYANPDGHQVPVYGPPPGWPNPQGWPTGDQSAEAHRAYCARAG